MIGCFGIERNFLWRVFFVVKKVFLFYEVFKLFIKMFLLEGRYEFKVFFFEFYKFDSLCICGWFLLEKFFFLVVFGCDFGNLVIILLFYVCCLI